MILVPESLNNSNISDRVFAEVLNLPESVEILIKCLKNLENQVQEVFDVINTTKEF